MVLLMKSNSLGATDTPSPNPHRLVLLDVNEHHLEFQMHLWHNLQQGAQFQCDLNNKVLGKHREFAHLPGALIQCIQLQQDAAL